MRRRPPATLRPLACILVLLVAGCRRVAPAPKTPTPQPTSSPLAIVVTPTVPLPPNMGLDAKIDPALARAIAASAPRTPAAVGESPAERAEKLAPPTPVPTARINP